MKRNLVLPGKEFNSSFLSCEKDAESIIRKLFIESRPYSDQLKRLLIINTPDCLKNETETASKILKDMSLSNMVKEGYIRLEPRLDFGEHEEVKSYIIITFDNFTPNETNPYFRDCTVTFDIICNTKYWGLNDYQLRPLKIAGYIDGILNNAKLSGIGVFNFMGCNQLVLSPELSGYSLAYRAVHGNDDNLEPIKE